MKEKFKCTNKKKLYAILAVSVVAIILIPMLYSSIYLSAFWDTYGKLNNVPVAFVNMDKAVSRDGTDYNIGKEVQDKLRDNDKVQWHFVSYEEAKKGVEGTTYYCMVVIPEDFSQKIADAKDGKFIKPEVIFEGNTGKNYIFSQISAKVADSIKNEVASSIQEETSKALVNNLNDVKKSIGDAADGANKLNDGTSKLYDGSNKLQDGISQATDGTAKLTDGLNQLAGGGSQLSSGMNVLIGGLNQLKDGMSQKNDKVAQLVNGASTVAKGSSLIKEGAADANTKLSMGLNSAADGVDQVSTYVKTANALMQSAMNNFKVNGSFSQQDMMNLMKAQAIIDGVDKKDISKNIGQPLRASSNALTPLVDKLGELEGGAKQVSDGTVALVNGLGENQNKAVEGINQLILGANQLKSGSSTLAEGLNTAAQKTGELSKGMTQINDGSKELNNGLKEANDGTSEFKNKLNDGYSEMNDKLKFTADDMSKFVGSPVELKDKSINKVNYYGEGLAPYFVSLSLWLGAMFATLLLSLAKPLNITENRFLKSFTGKFIVGGSISVIQALILSFALVKFLNIDAVNMSYFYLNNMFISLVFFNVMYGVSASIGIIGTPIMFVVFLLQLASSGGTFPIETAPKFFRVISPYLPMTYSVSLLRMVLTGINSAVFSRDIKILSSFMVLFLLGGLAVKVILNKKDENTDSDVDVAEVA